MKYIIFLLLLAPVLGYSQIKIDSITNARGICIPAIKVETQCGALILARDQEKFSLFYKTDNFATVRKSWERNLKIKTVTFHFLDRTLISFKCNGIGRASKNLSLSIQ